MKLRYSGLQSNGQVALPCPQDVRLYFKWHAIRDSGASYLFCSSHTVKPNLLRVMLSQPVKKLMCFRYISISGQTSTRPRMPLLMLSRPRLNHVAIYFQKSWQSSSSHPLYHRQASRLKRKQMPRVHSALPCIRFLMRLISMTRLSCYCLMRFSTLRRLLTMQALPRPYEAS